MPEVPLTALEQEIAGGARAALRRTLGPALEEFGLMLSDRVKLWRFRNLLTIREKADRLIAEKNAPAETLQALPFGTAMRVIEAASQEDEDDIQELWAKLIVSAATSETPKINKLHIELLGSLTPPDSAFLELLYPSVLKRRFRSADEVAAFNTEMNAKAESKWRQFGSRDQATSIQNLLRLRCITATPKRLNADQVLQHFPSRDFRGTGTLVDPRRFEGMLTQLLQLIYETSGALPISERGSVHLNSFGLAYNFIEVPEFNYMLTELGDGFMSAVTVDRKGETPNAPAE